MTTSAPKWMTNPHAGPAREVCPNCEGSRVEVQYGQQITCECCEGTGMIWSDELPEPHLSGCYCQHCEGPVPE